MRAGRKNDLAEWDIDTLQKLGERLDRPMRGRGVTVREFLSETLLRIRDRDNRFLPMRLNAAQRAFEQARGRRNIVLKARQMGLTTWVAARFFLNTITRPGTVTVQVAHSQDSAEALFRIVRRFAENLPESLCRGALKLSRCNARQLLFAKIDSEYRVETASNANAGRGLTINNLHASEVAMWPGDAAQTLASLRAAAPARAEITLESTPNGAHGCFYKEWLEAGRTGYQRCFLPWWLEPSYRRKTLALELDEEETALIANGLDEEQIAFRREARRLLGNRAKAEYAETADECFLASDECIFEASDLAGRLAELPAADESGDNGALQQYLPPVAGRSYIVAADPAGGGSEGDYSCLQVIDRQMGLQCAEWYGRCSPEKLAQKAAELARRYNEALLAVERNNHGAAVLTALRAIEKYDNLYGDRQGAGWLTNSLTRPQMIETMLTAMRANPQLFHSRRLLDECRSFVRDESGRAAAAAGCHDDAVMAMAIALAVRERISTHGGRAR